MSFEPIQFGKYQLIQPLAQGGMAEIFLARQQGPAGYEKTVVIKRVLSHYSEHPDFVAMFLDEARLAAQLSHPNIVQIFDFGESEGAYYLCMEYLRGEDLHTLVKLAAKQQVAISPQVAATVIAAACDALHYAHALTSEDGHRLNIVHRDISPSNLFVTFQGVVKVLDFGIARAEGKAVKTATGMIKGKLAYMAPEQARGGTLDGRADVWALGAVLHELLTGKRLFWRGNDVESFRALLDDPIPLPSELQPGIPRELDEICARALEREPDQRYPSARAMYADLDDFLSSRTYVPSQTLLQQYLQQLVGEEVVAAKLKSTLSKRPSPGPEPVPPPPPPPSGSRQSGSRSAPTKALGISGPNRAAETRAQPSAPTKALGTSGPDRAAETRAQPSAPRRRSVSNPTLALPDLERGPARRARSRDGVAATADPVAGGGPEEGAPPDPGAGSRRTRRAPIGIIAGVFGGLVIAAGIAAYWRAQSPEQPTRRQLAGPARAEPAAGPFAAGSIDPGPGRAQAGAEPGAAGPGRAQAGAEPGTAGPARGEAGAEPGAPEPAPTATVPVLPGPAPGTARRPPEPKPARGQLDINCVPWCRIFLDGKDTGRISPALGIPLSAGKHRLRVVNTPTGVEQEKEIVIRAGATTREVVKF